MIFNSIAVQENYLDFFGQAVAEKIGDQESELIESGGVPINQSELDKNRFENGNLAVQKWEFSEIREVVSKVLLFGF